MTIQGSVMQDVNNHTTPKRRQWLIIDATPSGVVRSPAEGNSTLQCLLNEALALPLDVVQSMWASVSLIEARLAAFPGDERATTSLIVDRELERVQSYLRREQGRSLGDVQVIVLTDETESSPSVISAFVARLCFLAGCEPEIFGVQQNSLMQWSFVEEAVVRQIAHRMQRDVETE